MQSRCSDCKLEGLKDIPSWEMDAGCCWYIEYFPSIEKNKCAAVEPKRSNLQEISGIPKRKNMGSVWKWLVPLNPMVLLIIIPFLNGYNWEYTLFSDKPTWELFRQRHPSWPAYRVPSSNLLGKSSHTTPRKHEKPWKTCKMQWRAIQAVPARGLLYLLRGLCRTVHQPAQNCKVKFKMHISHKHLPFL